MAEALGIDFALIHKERKKKKDPADLANDPVLSLSPPTALFAAPTAYQLGSTLTSSSFSVASCPPSCSASNRTLVGDVSGRQVFIVDDLADTCNTLIKAAVLCIAHGAVSVRAFVSHGLFSGNAIERLEASPISEVIVSHSLPMSAAMRQCTKIKMLDTSGLFAESIRRIHYGESVSFLFKGAPM